MFMHLQQLIMEKVFTIEDESENSVTPILCVLDHDEPA